MFLTPMVRELLESELSQTRQFIDIYTRNIGKAEDNLSRQQKALIDTKQKINELEVALGMTPTEFVS